MEGGCDGRDCCLPSNDKERGAGFMIADAPNSDRLQLLNPQVAYNQLDGAFRTVGGSEPAFNLSSFLGTRYHNDHSVTFITGPDGPGDQDVWMTGFLDGDCDIIGYDEFAEPGECALGKVSYLGGHSYSTGTPISGSWSTQGTRLFLNSLFEADCVTGGLAMGPRDRDGDGAHDGIDAFPDDPTRCGDTDMDGCDDCARGRFDPANDCEPVDSGAGGLDAGSTSTDGGTRDPGSETGGCGCRATGASSRAPLAALLLGLGLFYRRRRTSTPSA